jgi:hypothetical protein
MAKSKSLEKAVKQEVKEAQQEVKTGNVSTSKAPPQPVDLPTNTRRNLPPE